MATETTFFKIVKPSMAEEVNAFTLAYNIQLMSYVIYNLQQMTNPNFSLSVLQKSASASSAITSTDFRPPASDAKWKGFSTTNIYAVNTAESANTTSPYQFIQDRVGGYHAMLLPGYYRVAYQIHITMSASTQLHGTLRACLAFAGEWDKQIPRTYMQVPLNTQSATTTLNFEDIIKVVEQNYRGDDYDIMVHGQNDDIFWTTSASVGDPDQKFGVLFGQMNDAGLTGTVQGDTTWFTCEFLRTL